MPSEAASRALGIAALVLLAGGAFALGWQAPGVAVEPRGLQVRVFEPALAVSPGQLVSLPMAVLNHQAAAQEVTVRVVAAGPVRGDGASFTVPAGGERGVWIPLEVAESAAPGNYTIRLVVDSATPLRGLVAGEATVRVLAPGPGGIRTGDRVTIHFAAMLGGSGQVWDGSLPFANRSSFPLAAPFSGREGPVFWVIGEEDFLVGSSARLLGMRPGEARTLVVPPWDAFLNATVTDAFPRTTTLPAEVRAAPGANSTTRLEFTRWLDQSGQRSLGSWRIGESPTWRLVTTTGQVMPVKVRLTEIGSTDSAPVRWEYPALNERFTLFNAFPQATRITEKGATEWVIRTEPVQLPNATFTFAAYWPNASRITSCDPTCDGGYASARELTITHLDASWVGRSFLYSLGPFPHRFNVTAVGEEQVAVFGRNLHPLGGHQILWEVRVVAVNR